MRVALVHDWLTGYRGGERVLLHLARRFPHADLYTLFHTPGSQPAAVEALRITTSPLDRLPASRRHYRKLLPLFPWAIRQLGASLARAHRTRAYELVLSTSHAVAKSIPVPPGVPHVDYCFTPMRYVWDQLDAYLGERRIPKSLALPVVTGLRRFDVATSGPDSVTRFLAISSDVASRIERHYGRQSRLVPPPVDLAWLEVASAPADDYFLLVGGFVPYKRESLAIDAFRRLGRRLVVVGDGPGRRPLERRAPAGIEFTGRVSDAELARLYRDCRALVYPQHEDFGLVAVEAQAAGRPVIAYRAGGALDTVCGLVSDSATSGGDEAGERSPAQPASGPTGIFFEEQTPEAIVHAIERFEKAEHVFDPPRLRRWAERFSPARFDAALDHEIAQVRDGARPSAREGLR